ncbi:MAG: hypothetical protein QM790_18860 [Nibricoccus sp.]
MESHQEILHRLENAYRAYQADSLSKSSDEIGSQYLDNLEALYEVSAPKAPTPDAIAQAVKSLRLAQRTPPTIDEDVYGIREAAERLVSLLFPFNMRPAHFARRLAFKAIFDSGTGPANLPLFMRAWPNDEKIAFVIEIAVVLESYISIHIERNQDAWGKQHQHNILVELEGAGLKAAYEEDQMRWQMVREKYSEFEKLDRRYNSRKVLLRLLTECGLTDAQRELFDNAYSHLGYTLVRAKLGNIFPQIFSEFDRGQKETDAALTIYNHAYHDAEASSFKMPVGLEDRAWNNVIKAEPYNILRFADNILNPGRSMFWQKTDAADSKWVAACNLGLRETLRDLRALPIDWALRRPGTITAICEDLRLTDDPLTELEIHITKGEHRTVVVPLNSRIRPAIERARQSERRLLRYYLEKAGPSSPWTLLCAHMHRDDWTGRNSCSESCSRFSNSLIEKIETL